MEERVAEEKVLADKVAEEKLAIERLASVQATWGDNDAAAEAAAEQPAEQEEETPEGPPQDTAQQTEQVEFGDGDGSEQGPAEHTETAAADGAEQGDGSEQGAVVGTMPGEPEEQTAEEDDSEGKTLSDYALLQEAASPHGGKHAEKKMHVEKERAKPNGAKGGSSKGSEGLMELENKARKIAKQYQAAPMAAPMKKESKQQTAPMAAPMKTAPKRRLMTPNEVAQHEASAEKAALDKKLAEQDARDKMEAAKAAMQELEKKKDLADNAATTAAQAKEAAAQTAAEKMDTAKVIYAWRPRKR